MPPSPPPPTPTPTPTPRFLFNAQNTSHLFFPPVVWGVHREKVTVQTNLRANRLLRRNPRNVPLRPAAGAFRSRFRLRASSRRRRTFRGTVLGKFSEAADELCGGGARAAFAVHYPVTPHGRAAVLQPDHLSKSVRCRV